MALIPYTIGSPSVVYDQTARAAIGANWPDGMQGFVPQGSGNFLNWAAGGAPTTSIVKGTGTLANPNNSNTTVTSISGLPGIYDYAMGGPTIVSDLDASLIMVTHLERWPSGDSSKFWGSLGLIRSTNAGSSWTWLGEIIRPNWPFNDANSHAAECTGGPIVRLGNYLYVFYFDWPDSPNDTLYRFCVARRFASDVFAEAALGGVGAWSKYDGPASTDWNEEGLGGLGANLSDTAFLGWFDVAVHTPTGLIVKVASTPDPLDFGAYNALAISYSKDILTWTDPEILSVDGDETQYPTVQFNDATIARSGNGPIQLNYIFGTRWTDVAVKKRTLNLITGSRRTGGNKFRGGPACAVAR